MPGGRKLFVPGLTAFSDLGCTTDCQVFPPSRLRVMLTLRESWGTSRVPSRRRSRPLPNSPSGMMACALDQVAPLSVEVRKMFSVAPRAKWKTVRSPSYQSFGAWSLISMPSQNGEAGSHSLAPRRRRLARLFSSLPPSSMQENQVVRRSPLGISAIEGLWLCQEKSGPIEPGGIFTNGSGPEKKGSGEAGSTWAMPGFTSRAFSGAEGEASGLVAGRSPSTTRKPMPSLTCDGIQPARLAERSNRLKVE